MRWSSDFSRRRRLSSRYRVALIFIMGAVGVVLLVCSSIFWLFDISHLTFKQVLVILFCGVGAMTTSVLLSQLEAKLFPAEEEEQKQKKIQESSSRAA